MAVFRRRLIFWLIKAYLKKRGKVIALSFLFGLVVFFLLVTTSPFLTRLVPTEKKVTVGVVGAYPVHNLPSFVVNKISNGLTTVNDQGAIRSSVAKSWEVQDNGKKFVFHLRDNLRFHDGSKVNSKSIEYDFKDVVTERPDDQTIIFKLKDAYTPFLVTVSRPIFKKGSIGVGEFHVEDIELNGSFVKYLRIKSSKSIFKSEDYLFYPSDQALKVAFALGEVTQAIGLSDTQFHNSSFEKYPNVRIEKSTQYDKLVTLFYNTKDSVLSDKKVRSALTYALPDTFSEGQRSQSPYAPTSLYFDANLVQRTHNIARANELLSDLKTDGAVVKLQIKTQKKYRKTADAVAKAWSKIGIQTSIEEVDTVPAQYQVYLSDFSVPRDPDQYVLWHSTHINNITRIANQRIDKLLEDGRTTVDTNKRQEIYFDFQKYLQDESPASFLYFPYSYTLTRT